MLIDFCLHHMQNNQLLSKLAILNHMLSVDSAGQPNKNFSDKTTHKIILRKAILAFKIIKRLP